MNQISMEFPRSKGAATATIVIGLAFATIGIIVTTFLSVGWVGPGFGPYLPVLFMGGIGLVLIIGGIVAFFDQAPKLSADANGITDHRAGARAYQIPWPTIQSIDFDSYRLTLIVCHTSRGSRVEATNISIGSLQGGALAIFAAIKAAWLEFKKTA